MQVAFGALSEPAVRAPEPWWAAAGQQAEAAQTCTPGAFHALPHAGPASEHSGLRQVPVISELSSTEFHVNLMCKMLVCYSDMFKDIL